MDRQKLFYYLAIFLIFLPFILSIRSVSFEFFSAEYDVVILNVLYSVVLSAFIAVLFPVEPSRGVGLGSLIVITTAVFGFGSYVIPLPVIEFAGFVYGRLTIFNTARFLFANIHAMLYVFAMSFYLEHEVSGYAA